MENQLINSRKVFSGRVFDVYQDQVLLPDGNTTRLDVVRHTGSVVIVPMQNDGSLLFVRQYRHPAGLSLLELPAGVINEGEEPEACARRELREETGLAAGKMVHLGDFFLAPGYSTELMNAFLATALFPDPLEADKDEFITVEAIPLEKALAMAINGEIPDAKSLAALFLAKSHLNNLIKL
jgi:ADP-ribose pyrophosphatase